MSDDFPEETLQDLAHWVAWFSNWHGDGHRHPDFAKYLTDNQRRQRTRRVMRQLRRSNIRAYEVCYRVLNLAEPLDQTTEWLNERATRNNIPYPAHRPGGPHYTRKDAMALLISGLTFAKQYW